MRLNVRGSRVGDKKDWRPNRRALAGEACELKCHDNVVARIAMAAASSLRSLGLG
jgi:hypothetical protein